MDRKLAKRAKLIESQTRDLERILGAESSAQVQSYHKIAAKKTSVPGIPSSGVDKSASVLQGAATVKKGGPSRLMKIMAVVGAVAAIVAIAAMLIDRESPHSSSAAVVTSFMEAYVKGDASQMLDTIDPRYLEELMVEEGIGMDELWHHLQALLDEWQRELGKPGVWISFEVGDTLVQDGRARTTVKMKSDHPDYGYEEFTETFTTVQRDGRWYLEEFLW